MIRPWISLVCLVVLAGGWASGCAQAPDPAAPSEPPSAQAPGPAAPTEAASIPGSDVPPGERGPVYVDTAELLLMESFPVQVNLQVKGALPTPCHELKWEVEAPDSSGRIDVALYSLADPTLACIQVLEDFEAGIPLGSYAEGTYTVYLNGKLVGEVQL